MKFHSKLLGYINDYLKGCCWLSLCQYLLCNITLDSDYVLQFYFVDDYSFSRATRLRFSIPTVNNQAVKSSQPGNIGSEKIVR